MIKAVLFDMDGVLVDTEWFYNRRRVAYLETQGFTFEEIPDLSGSNEKAIWEYFVPDDPVRRERLRRGYGAYQKEHPVPYDQLLNPQTRQVFERLKACGYRTAIASSSYEELIQELIDVAGIRPFVDFSISGHQCTAFKPSPEIYLRAMIALGVTERECVVVEDSPLGIAAGKAAGAVVLALRPRPGVVLDQSRADAVIDTLGGVFDFLPAS